MDLLLQPLRKFADFEGRARRSEFWLFQVFKIVLIVVWLLMVGVISVAMGGASGDGMPAMGGLLFVAGVLALLVPSTAVAVRRLHDVGLSGWWLLIGLVPFLGALALLVIFLVPGTDGPNSFGQDPHYEPRQNPFEAFS